MKVNWWLAYIPVWGIGYSGKRSHLMKGWQMHLNIVYQALVTWAFSNGIILLVRYLIR